ncbi:AIR carboxylase [Caulifigura coniformis]|uniref:AIR carboxylase n=1 Tax=Caulifigura coniformis TaxID=2527983 RepID=A0A517SD71_9PLAN|nr:nickel pincer cofactor biosynthesis protein LarB [Caulifigura coniformis]QDT54068.1 AIR carboxylase [Caulifigura coniformis]
MNSSIPGVTLDLARADRCGYPEVVYGEGKTPEQIIEVFRAQQAAGQACLATRISAPHAEAVLAAFPHAVHHPVARTIRLTSPSSRLAVTPLRDGLEGHKTPAVLVVTAGSSDRPAAEEALETLAWAGAECALITDVGVAGPQRLLKQVDRLSEARVVIVVAGMEGALPSVVGGWLSCPVIAVPTSVGYGTSFGGLTALLGMLNSCAANVAVVNIDAGFKAGYLAALMLRSASPGPQES